jgi:hypothetical protein
VAEDPDLTRAQRHLYDEDFFWVSGYFRHMRRAWGFAWVCFKSSIKGIIHGIYPGWFENTSVDIEEWLI